MCVSHPHPHPAHDLEPASGHELTSPPQVNWPRLKPRNFAVEGYHEHLSKAGKDAVLGTFVTRHERGLSAARYLNAEEGKKRIE